MTPESRTDQGPLLYWVLNSEDNVEEVCGPRLEGMSDDEHVCVSAWSIGTTWRPATRP